MSASTEQSYEQKVEANRRAKVPPGARLLRTVQWKDAEGRSLMVVVPHGMQVADNLKAFYWAEHDTFSELLAAGATLADFVVVNDDNQIVAISCVEPDYDAADIAWLSCMFMEMMNCRLAFVTSKELDCSNVKGAVQCFVPLGAANG